MALNQKQEIFCQLVIQGYAYWKAYAEVYNVKNCSNKTIRKNAWRLMAKQEVKDRIKELRGLSAMKAVDARDALIHSLFESLERASGKMMYEEYELVDERDENGNPTDNWKETNIVRQKVNIADVVKTVDTLAKLYGLYDKQEQSSAGVVINVNGGLDD